MPAPPRTRQTLVAAALVAAGVIGALLLMREKPAASLGAKRSKLVAASRMQPELGPRPQQAEMISSPQAAEQLWREAPTRSGVDASNSYKNAFVLFDRLSEEEKKMLREPRAEVDEEKAAALFEKIRAIMELLREAAKADYCEWGQAPYSFDTPMPQITKAQDLGKLALWAAAYQFPTDPAAALTALADRAQLGHHLADTLIGVLVQTSFERSAHDLLLQHAGSFDPATATQAREILKGSKLDDDLARAFVSEAVMVGAIGKQLAAEREKGGTEMLSMILAPTEHAKDQATAKRLYESISDPVRLAAEVAFIQEYQRALAAALKLPEAEYQAWRQSMEGKLNGDHPLAQMIVPTINSVQPRLQQTRVERTLLSAGLEVMQGGPAQLARYRDPATGQALLYVPTPTGFELRSTYQVKGKPVTMSFSQRK